MQKQLSTDLTPDNSARVIELLAQTPRRLDALSRRFSDEALRQVPAPGERSATENLAHLLHCEARVSEAIYLALLTSAPTLAAIHPERQFGKLVGYTQFEFSALRAYFKFRRTVLLRVLGGLKAVQWARTVRQPGKQRQESVYWQARGLALHELEHVPPVDAGPTPP